MAIIHIAGRLPIHVEVTPWWAFTYSFSPLAVPGAYSFTLDGAVDTSAHVCLTNEIGEPPYAITGYLQETKRTAEGKVTYSFVSDAKNSNVNTKIAEIAPPAKLKRNGTTYTLVSDSDEWETISLTTASGVAYTLAAWRVYDDIYIIANGVKVTSGTDADGNAITEASYIESGQTWTLDLPANLPDKTLYEAVSPYYIATGRRLMYDEGNVTQAYLVMDEGSRATTPIDYDFSYPNINIISLTRITNGGCACAEDIEVGAYKYPTRNGYVAYAEGWTDPLMGWKRENGTSAQCIVSIGVNGMATTGNYLDDEGKPYTGLIYKTRPEPTQSPAFVEQFARLKTARTCTFNSVKSLGYMTPYTIGEYIGYITHKKRDGRRWTYEAEVYSPLSSGEILTPTTLVYGFEGGTKAISMTGYASDPSEQVKTYTDLFVPSSFTDGITTTMRVTCSNTSYFLASALNPVSLEGTTSSATGWQPDIATKTGTLSSIPEITYKIYGAELNFVNSGEVTERDNDLVAFIPTFTFDRDKTLAGSIKMFTWYPTYYSTGWDIDYIRIEQGVMSGEIFRVTGFVRCNASDRHSFALFFADEPDDDVTHETIPAVDQTYIAYDLYNVPSNWGLLNPNQSYIYRVLFHKGPAYSTPTKTLRMWQFSPLPYSE